ncbi:MAG: hypothetical protein QM726_14730 [Chitinophagaceae bacterium]
MIKSLKSPLLLLTTAIITVIVLFTACSKDDNSNPDAINALVDTLKANPNCTCEPYLNEYRWQSKIIYVLGNRGAACQWIPTYYDAKAQPYILPAEYSYDMFIKEATLVKNVWTCK